MAQYRRWHTIVDAIRVSDIYHATYASVALAHVPEELPAYFAAVLPDWVLEASHDRRISFEYGTGGRVLLAVRGMVAAPAYAFMDDWLIRDSAGNLFLCNPDIFAATYHPMSDASEEMP